MKAVNTFVVGFDARCLFSPPRILLAHLLPSPRCYLFHFSSVHLLVRCITLHCSWRLVHTRTPPLRLPVVTYTHYPRTHTALPGGYAHYFSCPHSGSGLGFPTPFTGTVLPTPTDAARLLTRCLVLPTTAPSTHTFQLLARWTASLHYRIHTALFLPVLPFPARYATFFPFTLSPLFPHAILGSWLPTTFIYTYGFQFSA